MDPFICANQHQGDAQGDAQDSCSQKGVHACAACGLVLYCSKHCQVAHWPVHKLDCKSPLRKSSWKPAWELEHRVPNFMSGMTRGISVAIGANLYASPQDGVRQIWEKVPAMDLLQLADNEGSNTSQDIHLLLAATADSNNLVKTIACLPEEYQGHIHLDINSTDEIVAARTLLMLLIALHFPPDIASDMILHLWYSAFLPEPIVHSIQSIILPIVKSILAAKLTATPQPLLATWTHQKVRVNAGLDVQTWDLLLACEKVPDISFEDAARLRKSGALPPSQQDFIDRALLKIPPSWRVAKMKFQTDGILLPFGASRSDFKIPNPTFFYRQKSWLMNYFADPMDGWKLSEVLKEPHAAKDDIYGLLFRHVRRHLLKFCGKLRTLKADISVLRTAVSKLPARIKEFDEGTRYDRIEVATLVDQHSLGPKQILSLYGPLLKHPSRNSKATLITLFRHAVNEMLFAEHMPTPASTFMVRQVLPMDQSEIFRGEHTGSFHTFANAHRCFIDMNPAFGRYMKRYHLEELGKSAGVEMKSKHTIVAKWPVRLPKSPTKREFEMLFWSGHDGAERYVEWRMIR